MTPKEMSEHIHYLAAKHNVAVAVQSGASGRAWRRHRQVRISPVKSAVTYAIALHELGHVVGRSANTRLEKEVAAWEWARENALIWTETMTKKMRRSLLSYRKWADRRNGVNRDCPALDALI